MSSPIAPVLVTGATGNVGVIDLRLPAPAFQP